MLHQHHTMEEMEVVVLCVLVGLMMVIVVLPFVMGRNKKKNNGAGTGEEDEEQSKKKKGLLRSQLCLQPGCLRCAFSTDPATLAAFKRHVWETLTEDSKRILHQEDRRTIEARVGPAIKQLVTRSAALSMSAGRCFLPIEGLPRVLSAPVMKFAKDAGLQSELLDVDSLSWIGRLLPSIPLMAEEARSLWRGRRAESNAREWRRDEVGVDDDGVAEAKGWKWDLWNQGSFLEPRAQSAPQTVRLLQQHAADNMMVLLEDLCIDMHRSILTPMSQAGCAFGFAYFYFIERFSKSENAADDVVQCEDVGLRRRHTRGAKNEEKSESDTNETTSSERCGPTNARLRCMLVLSVPDDSAFTVTLRMGTSEERWENEVCLVCDDSTPHTLQVRIGNGHPSDQDAFAATLVFDLWHPMLTPIERHTLCRLFPASVDVGSSSLVD